MFLFITPGTPRIVIISYSINYGVRKCIWTALGDVSANIVQATLGANISVPTIDGENKEIEIPPGTQTGDLIKIKGQGSPVLGRSNVRGDHLVNIIVKIPRKLSRAQQRLFEELSKEMIDDKAAPYAREESWFKKMMNNIVGW